MDPIDEMLLPVLDLPETEWEVAVAALCSSAPASAAEIRRRYGILKASGFASGPPAPENDFPKRLGSFRLEERLGTGGMGVVYRAHDEALDREVALKLVRPEHLYFPGARERFRREIEAVAKLSHPGIVSIHTLGEEAGLPFFAMELLRGATLDDVLRELTGRAPEKLTGKDLGAVVARRAGVPQETLTDGLFEGTWTACCLEIARRVAQALAHAHDKGVIHRDVKPSNVLVTPEGRVVLLDFGLAFAPGADRLTRTGAQLGSLPYMAPEQVRGESVDAKSDIYALGVTFYELLALRQPFLTPSGDETRRRILLGTARSLRSCNAAVTWEIETICACARELDPRHRYGKIGDFARDLENAIDDRPILARPASSLRRARLWVRRHPALTTGATLGLVLLVGAPTGIALGIAAQRDRAFAAEAEQVRKTYYADIAAANAALEANDSRTAARHLERCDPALRGWEWNALTHELDSSLASLSGHTGAITVVTASPEGRFFASGDRDGVILLWDVASPTPQARFASGESAIEQLAFDAGSTLLHCIDAKGTTRAIDLATKDVVASRPSRDSSERVLLDVAGGNPLLTSGGWSVTELEPRTLRPGRTIRLASVDRPPSSYSLRVGGTLCSVSMRGMFCWDLPSGRLKATARNAPFNTSGCFAGCRNTDLVAVADQTGRVSVFHTGDGSLAQSLDGRGAAITALAFDARGLLLAGVGSDLVIRVWDVRTGRLVLQHHGHTDVVSALAISGDRMMLVSGSRDRHVKLWSGVAMGSSRDLLGHQGRITRLFASANGDELYSTSEDGSVRAWNARSGEPLRSEQRFPHHVNALCATRGGTRLMVSYHSTLVEVAAATLEPGHHWTVPGWVHEVIALPDGRHALAICEQAGGLVLDLDRREVLHQLGVHGGSARTCACSPDGSTLFTGSTTGEVATWSTATGLREATLVANGPKITALATSLDGSAVFAAEIQRLRALHPKTGAVLWEQQCSTRTFCALSFAGGTRLATGHEDGTLVIWDAAHGWPILSMRTKPSGIRCLAIAPSQAWIATGYQDGSIAVHDALPHPSEPGNEQMLRDTERSAARFLLASLRDRFASTGRVLEELRALPGLDPTIADLTRKYAMNGPAVGWVRAVICHSLLVSSRLDETELDVIDRTIREAGPEVGDLALACSAFIEFRRGRHRKALELANRFFAGRASTEPDDDIAATVLGLRAIVSTELGQGESVASDLERLTKVALRPEHPDTNLQAFRNEVEEALASSAARPGSRASSR